MTNLSRLNVSLTKHGAHKIALLLDRYDIDDVLEHLWGTDAGIKIDAAQASKNLSVDDAGKVPDIWNRARQLGQDSINALVLVAIIFSHYKLISAMKGGASGNDFTGTIVRGIQLDDKAYTNFAHTIDELGFSTKHTVKQVSYDLAKLFLVRGISTLVAEMISIKLKAAGWEQNNALVEEAIKYEFHKVFSLSKSRFAEWLSAGVLKEEKQAEDASFFLGIDNSSDAKPFKFVAGHTKRKIGKVSEVIGPVPQIAPKKHAAGEIWQGGMRRHGRPIEQWCKLPAG